MTVQVQNKIFPRLDDPNLITEQRLQDDRERYEQWLNEQARYARSNDSVQEMTNYQRLATQVVQLDNREICTFAPFHPELSALETLTKSQVIALYALLLSWGVLCILFGVTIIFLTFAVIIGLYGVNLLLNVLMTFKALQPFAQEQIDDTIVHALKDADWPQYTILCPLYREATIVPQFVKAIQALDYPVDKLQVLFITEENDPGTRLAIQSLALPAHFHILTVPNGHPRTKPRACNYGLLHATGRYVVIYDAEDIPDPLQLKKAVLTFANHGTDLACVQAKLNCYNAQQNILTRWYTADYSMWFNLVLLGLQHLGFALPLGGTSNHFPTATLRILGGWDAYNVTEDCDLGLRLDRCHLKVVMLDSTTLEEATSLLPNWLRQRSRWIKGYMQTYLVYMRHPLKTIKEGHFKNLLSLQMVVGNRIGLLFLNPLMWGFTLTYIICNQNPSVVAFYHTIFPRLALYLGLFCLVFGNFFYMYLYLLGCLKQQQYKLIPWALLIPGHWILASIAALFALWELIRKPHYWQKTVHGKHLIGARTVTEEVDRFQTAPQLAYTGQALATQQTSIMYAVPTNISKETSTKYTLPAIVARLRTMQQALPPPSLSYEQKRASNRRQIVSVRDFWLVAVLLTACITSLVACAYYAHIHAILIYTDAYSHVRIARNVFNSTNPGLAQLGTVWLPLPQVSMFPFIWNDYLWRTGLAGSLPSMIYYVITASYLYLIMRRLTGNRMLSYLGTGVFLLNANILYLQSTPLSELTCICTITMACYYFLAWIQDKRDRLLIFSGASTFLAVLARYEGWAMFLALCALVLIIGRQRRYRWEQGLGNLILYALLPGFGIALWLLWNQALFGDALAFQRGPFSAQAQQLVGIQSGTLYTYHNLWMSLVTYTVDIAETTNPVLFALAILGLFLLLIRRRFSPEVLVILAFFAIFGFDVLSLYTGQIVIQVFGVPSGNVALSNTRYGSEMVGPVALFLTILAHEVGQFLHHHLHRRLLIQWGLAAVLLTQVGFGVAQSPITLQDGLSGACGKPQALNQFLAQHYDGGMILEDETAGDFSLSDAGIDFKTVVYQGSTDLWPQALAHPEQTVDWIINSSNPQSFLNQRLHLNSPAFLAHFTLTFEDPSGLLLYRRKGEPPLPSRPVPPDMWVNTCNIHKK